MNLLSTAPGKRTLIYINKGLVQLYCYALTLLLRAFGTMRRPIVESVVEGVRGKGLGDIVVAHDEGNTWRFSWFWNRVSISTPRRFLSHKTELGTHSGIGCIDKESWGQSGVSRWIPSVQGPCSRFSCVSNHV